MDNIPALANTLGVVGLLLMGGYCLHKGYLVLGRTYDRDCQELRNDIDEYKKQLQESNAAIAKTNATNAELASLVPGLVKQVQQAQRGEQTT